MWRKGAVEGEESRSAALGNRRYPHSLLFPERFPQKIAVKARMTSSCFPLKTKDAAQIPAFQLRFSGLQGDWHFLPEILERLHLSPEFAMITVSLDENTLERGLQAARKSLIRRPCRRTRRFGTRPFRPSVRPSPGGLSDASPPLEPSRFLDATRARSTPSCPPPPPHTHTHPLCPIFSLIFPNPTQKYA